MNFSKHASSNFLGVMVTERAAESAGNLSETA